MQSSSGMLPMCYSLLRFLLNSDHSASRIGWLSDRCLGNVFSRYCNVSVAVCISDQLQMLENQRKGKENLER